MKENKDDQRIRFCYDGGSSLAKTLLGNHLDFVKTIDIFWDLFRKCTINVSLMGKLEAPELSSLVQEKPFIYLSEKPYGRIDISVSGINIEEDYLINPQGLANSLLVDFFNKRLVKMDDSCFAFFYVRPFRESRPQFVKFSYPLPWVSGKEVLSLEGFQPQSVDSEYPFKITALKRRGWFSYASLSFPEISPQGKLPDNYFLYWDNFPTFLRGINPRRMKIRHRIKLQTNLFNHVEASDICHLAKPKISSWAISSVLYEKRRN